MQQRDWMNPVLHPYAFERGEHRDKVPEMGALQAEACTDNYQSDTSVIDKEDVVLAWLRNDKDCAKMQIEEELMDSDLVTSDWDD
jgi:hypothetical protein